MAGNQRSDHYHIGMFLLAALLICLGQTNALAEELILQLKNGDRLTGTLLSETTNSVVLSNAWSGQISVPLNQIARRTNATPISATAALTNAAPISVIATNVAVTNAAPAKVAPTNATVAVSAKAPAKTVTNTLPTPKPKYWKGEVELGLDLLYGAKERQNVFGRLKLNYEKPYEPGSRLFFRNAFDYNAEYGETDGVKSSDRMNASDKTDFDMTPKWYLYNLVGVGYDHIRKIDLQYEVGPGLGYHLVKSAPFTMNLELGANYQMQYREGVSDLENFYFRAAENLTWKISPRATLTEKFEFFPRVDLSEYRFRFESNLAYQLWRNVSLNITVMDRFDTERAPGVDHNELQVRSSLGVKF